MEKLDLYKKYRLILLHAPAGYGKTTLLTSWKNSLSNTQSGQNIPQICWLNLNESDNEKTMFFGNFLGAFYLNKVVPADMRSKAVKLLGGCSSFHHQHLMYFINDAAKLKQEMIFILDNIQFIGKKDILQEILFLSEYLPEHMHLILSGRTVPEMNLAKQRICAKVLDIRQDDLAFTQEENAQFCIHRIGSDCSDAHIRSIFEQTEGWPAGARLMTLPSQNAKPKTNRKTWIAGGEELLSGRSRQLLYDYLMEEVFRNLKAEYKKFLMDTSLPDYFSLPLCRFMMDQADADSYIRSIKRKNIFLCGTDGTVEEYRYHTMFREFLLKQFSLQEEAVQLRQYRKLARWYEGEKRWDEAITFTIRGKDYKKAIELMEQISSNLGCRGEAGILSKWNRMLPLEQVENNPRLLLNGAWAALSGGRREKAQIYLKRLGKLKLTAHMKKEIAVLDSTDLSPFDPNLDHVLQGCKEAAGSLKEDEFLTQLLYFNMGTAWLFLGNLKESMYAYEKCRNNSMVTGEYYLSIVSNQAISRYHIQKGQYQKAQQESMELLWQMEEREEVIISAKGLLLAVLAELQLLQHNPQKARILAKQGLELGKFGEDYWTMGENLLVLAKICRSEGKEEELEVVSAEFKSSVKGRRFFDLEIRAGIFFSEKQIEEGNLELARQWLYHRENELEEKFRNAYSQIHLLRQELDRMELEGIESDNKGADKIKSAMQVKCVLSVREQEILKLVSEGCTNAEISDRLSISINTVKTHLLKIFDKLEVHNRWKAAAIAKQRNLIWENIIG